MGTLLECPGSLAAGPRGAATAARGSFVRQQRSTAAGRPCHSPTARRGWNSPFCRALAQRPARHARSRRGRRGAAVPCLREAVLGGCKSAVGLANMWGWQRGAAGHDRRCAARRLRALHTRRSAARGCRRVCTWQRSQAARRSPGLHTPWGTAVAPAPHRRASQDDPLHKLRSDDENLRTEVEKESCDSTKRECAAALNQCASTSPPPSIESKSSTGPPAPPPPPADAARGSKSMRSPGGAWRLSSADLRVLRRDAYSCCRLQLQAGTGRHRWLRHSPPPQNRPLARRAPPRATPRRAHRCAPRAPRSRCGPVS